MTDEKAWTKGWPRGTWVKTLNDRVFEVGQTVTDVEGNPMYLVPLPWPNGGREAIYCALAVEARTADGRVIVRRV